MSQPDLFPVEESLSPRLKWMAAHGIKTMSDAEFCEAAGLGDADDSVWAYSYKDGLMEAQQGATEEEACERFSAAHNIPHWLAPLVKEGA